jgi:hypothetical protein
VPEPLSYASLGVRRVINAAATLTDLGESVMPDEVVDAMRMAAGSHVDMHELQAAVGAELAWLTRNEAGYVSVGAQAWLLRSSPPRSVLAGSYPQTMLKQPEFRLIEPNSV